MQKQKRKEIEKIQKLAHIDEYKFVSNKNEDADMAKLNVLDAMAEI